MLYRYPADRPELGMRGNLDLVRTSDGYRPRRLPRVVWDQVPSAFMQTMADCSAGVRLRFQTESRSVALSLLARPLHLVDVGMRFAGTIDLVVEGIVVASRQIGQHHIPVGADTRPMLPDGAEPETVEFSGLQPGLKLIELWLPHTAVVDLLEVVTDAPALPAPQAQPTWVHYGSSISHCLETSAPTRTWPALVSRELDLDLLSLGIAGSALLDPFAARVIRDTDADLITMKIGINLVNLDVARERTFAPLVHGFLDTIREGHPVTPIVVISPVICPAHENLPGPTGMDSQGVAISLAEQPPRPDALTLTDIRRILEETVAQRAKEDHNLSYLSGEFLLDRTDAASGRLPDGLHPDELGYQLMAERIAPVLTRVLESRVPRTTSP